MSTFGITSQMIALIQASLEAQSGDDLIALKNMGGFFVSRAPKQKDDLTLVAEVEVGGERTFVYWQL